jgi:hypothetical protein
VISASFARSRYRIITYPFHELLISKAPKAQKTFTRKHPRGVPPERAVLSRIRIVRVQRCLVAGLDRWTRWLDGSRGNKVRCSEGEREACHEGTHVKDWLRRREAARLVVGAGRVVIVEWWDNNIRICVCGVFIIWKWGGWRRDAHLPSSAEFRDQGLNSGCCLERA